MFSKLYYFVLEVSTLTDRDTRTLAMARDLRFEKMSRAELLGLRDAAFGLANDITAHLTAIDIADAQ